MLTIAYCVSVVIMAKCISVPTIQEESISLLLCKQIDSLIKR